MRSYEEIKKGYQKRQRDTLIDSLATSLNYMDEICVEAGILDAAGIWDDLLGGACAALPFVLIAVTEQYKVILGRKPAKTGVVDAAFRMAKSGTAMGVGAVVAGTAGFAAAIPVSIGIRAAFDHYRVKAFTGKRVMMRTQRMRQMQATIAPPIVIREQPLLTSGTQSLKQGE